MPIACIRCTERRMRIRHGKVSLKEAKHLKIHMARKGDTLWNLAEKFNVHPDALFDYNPHIRNPELLEPGVKVKIPIPPSPLEQPPAEFMYKHVVRPGDTLWKLSKAWNVPLKALISVNPQLRNPNVLNEGEFVFVPKLSANIASEQEPDVHIAAQSPKTNVKVGAKKETAVQPEAKIAPIGYEQPVQSMGFASPQEYMPYESASQSMHDGDPMFWGDMYPAYTTNVSNPYQSYNVDPRINLPIYPAYDAEYPGQQQQALQPEAANAEQPVATEETVVESPKRSARSDGKGKGAAGKDKGKRKQPLGMVASVPVRMHRSGKGGKPIRKSSRPWTNL